MDEVINMDQEILKALSCVCHHCSHQWYRRKLDSLPLKCARCGNPNWLAKKEEGVVENAPKL